MPSGYQRKVLYQNDFFELVSIIWARGEISSSHNHGSSRCMVLIQEGQFENIMDLGFKTESRLFIEGEVLETPVGAKHSMHCISTSGKTLHVYTPKVLSKTEGRKFRTDQFSDLGENIDLKDAVSFEELKKLMELIKENSISTDSPYFMNQLFAGVMPQMILAEEILAQTRTTLATHEASPVFSKIEEEVVDSLGKIIGWSDELRDGVSVPGGSAANFMAVHCARHRAFPNMKSLGMGSVVFKVYVSAEAHYSMEKACSALGIGTANLVKVPVDQSGRMNAESLAEFIKKHRQEGATPLMVCATAGTTVQGAFDPFEKLAQICTDENLWLHVDAAWGGPALFSKQLRPLTVGIEKADSVTFDAHKLFGANLTCSFFLTRHPGLLLRANDVSGGDYLFHGSEPDRGKMSWQCGRKADSFSFWSIWKSLGDQGLGNLVDQLVEIREQTLNWIETQSRLQMVADASYLNICVRVVPPQNLLDPENWSKHVREKLIQNNLCMVNYSQDAGGTFLRLILAHPYLKFQHVQQILTWALAVE